MQDAHAGTASGTLMEEFKDLQALGSAGMRGRTMSNHRRRNS